MILAAGRGERMRPLTDELPKPLLEAGGKPLLQYHVENLARSGFDRVVINHARLGELIEARFGDGRSFNLEIVYSAEGYTPLETGGGIKKALPLLGPEPFLVVNADVWTDLEFSGPDIAEEYLAHLILVPNPDHNPGGDFALDQGTVINNGSTRLTYSGIGVYRPELFTGCSKKIFSTVPLLQTAADRGEISGEVFGGLWLDIGTPERLVQLEKLLLSV